MPAMNLRSPGARVGSTVGPPSSLDQRVAQRTTAPPRCRHSSSECESKAPKPSRMSFSAPDLRGSRPRSAQRVSTLVLRQPVPGLDGQMCARTDWCPSTGACPARVSTADRARLHGSPGTIEDIEHRLGSLASAKPCEYRPREPTILDVDDTSTIPNHSAADGSADRCIPLRRDARCFAHVLWRDGEVFCPPV